MVAAIFLPPLEIDATTALMDGMDEAVRQALRKAFWQAVYEYGLLDARDPADYEGGVLPE